MDLRARAEVQVVAAEVRPYRVERIADGRPGDIWEREVRWYLSSVGQSSVGPRDIQEREVRWYLSSVGLSSVGLSK